MNALTDLEFRIIDELYFVSSFQNLLESVGEESVPVSIALKNLIMRKLVEQIKISEGNEEKLQSPDFESMHISFFVASKEGLLIHNSRN